jgi:antitoxin (DNA-binding transcriptional repressor) of toxin-antitoxin stability system
VSVSELRNHTAQVIAAVRSGERLAPTVDRTPVADIVPHGGIRSPWIASDRWRPHCGSGGGAPSARLPRDDLRRATIDGRPAPTGNARADAYLGALAEHLAATAGPERPTWPVEHGRVLERFWFPSPVPGFRALAIAIAESPAAFRRRGIFIARGALERV